MYTILIVEDDEDLLNGLHMILTKEGYRVLRTGQGDKGLDIAVQEKPNLIILDAVLPGISGSDLRRALREKGVRVPIVMMSATAESRDRKTGLSPEADSYIAKPFGSRELLNCVRTQLQDT